jgi:hypothetical protein
MNLPKQGEQNMLIQKCGPDYGVLTILFAMTVMIMGYFQMLRLVLYQVLMVHHQACMGEFEVLKRRPLSDQKNDEDKEVDINFKVIKFSHDLGCSETDDEESVALCSKRDVSLNKLCSICFQDFKPGIPIVCLPCSV